MVTTLRTLTCAAVALSLGLVTVAEGQERIRQSAVRQIQTLLREKAQRTPAQQKIDSRLLAAQRLRSDRSFRAALPALRSAVELDRRGQVLVDLRAAVSGPLLNYVVELGGDVVSALPARYFARVRVPLAAVERLAEWEEVRAIAPAERFVLNKVDTSEGDVTHRADLARSTLSVDGTGVKIGVLSDGVDTLVARQMSGDLPAVTVLAAGSGDEGTAMLEIVHDLAPGASLFFATANGGQANFANNILALQGAGCEIVVDDVFYFSEGVFQDDTVAAAVNTVTAASVLYFSSAGNAGNLNDGTSGVWEGDYTATSLPAPLTGAGSSANDFGGGSNSNEITGDPPFAITLQWADPLGASNNDYDLFLLDAGLATLFAQSTNSQTGNQDPFELIDSEPFNDVGNRLVVVKSSGAGDRFLSLNTIRGRLGAATAGQTSGHSATEGGFGVAAVNVADATGGTFAATPGLQVETFSSDGPRRVFYEENGTPITPGNFSSTGGRVRVKPDLTAADGVSTSTPGFSPFFGTSAAAPHAAAIAGLMQENGNLTPAGAAAAFAATSIDIEAPGVDRDAGVGVLDALRAVGTTTPTAPDCYAATLTLSGTPSSGPQTFRACSRIDASEGQFDDVTLEAFDPSPASAGVVALGNGFRTAGPFHVRTTP